MKASPNAAISQGRHRGAAVKNRARAVMVLSGKLKVAVTGAGGRTGALVVQKLLQRPQEFEVRAVVRNKKSTGKLPKDLKEGALVEADISQGLTPQLSAALEGIDALVIATSGVPQLKWQSLPRVLWAKLTGQQGVRPEFVWKGGQLPEQVDWLGQKAQVDAAKVSGVKHVVLVSSMGGTDPTNALNQLGGGNILLWKRKAEQYLIASGLEYTVIHPGGLIDQEGGQRELLLGVDDTLIKRTQRSIPRADVAELAVQSLLLPEARNRSFDAITLPPGEGKATTDFAALIGGLEGNCDYTINSQL